MNDRSHFTIGEFSKVTGLTVKTLRFYHEQGILSPTAIDHESGYRYYDERKIEAARIIAELRRLDFSIAEIGDILRSCADDSDLLDSLHRQRKAIEARMQHDREISRRLDQLIDHERELRETMQNTTFEVQQKNLEPIRIAAVRMQGKYRDCGKAFAQIGKRFGRHICGQAFLLHYDAEYHEDDADFEACLPIRQVKSVEGTTVRELPGGRCVALVHKGPYDQMGRSYAKVLKWIKERNYKVVLPTREVYLKGPGMIFRGNPKNYVTEIQFLVR
jgi:DNA-binding transcriptional MerR regulator